MMYATAFADFLVASIGIGSLFAASALIGYEMLKKRNLQRELFNRYHAEEAMRIKAKQYKNY
jgi:hypothetical protein